MTAKHARPVFYRRKHEDHPIVSLLGLIDSLPEGWKAAGVYALGLTAGFLLCIIIKFML